MFRLNKHKAERLGERMEFKFSNIQAFKVPKGWDKLFVSVISVETGKTIAKSNKATVRSGTCQWTESLSEYIPISQDGGRKDPEGYFFKFIISMGSGKLGVLGEVVLNLADHISSSDSTPLTLPLNKCNYGTILQVKIQCFDPRTRFSEGSSSRITSSRLEMNASSQDMDNKSDTSDNTNNGSSGYISSNRTMTGSYPDGSINRDTVSMASGSHSSSDSTENSLGRTHFSPKNIVNGSSHVGRQDSAGSHASATSSAGPVDDLSRSNQSSFNSRASGSSTPHQWQEATVQAAAHGNTSLSLKTSGSAKELLEEAEETIDELRDEAKMWERHSQKLKVDLEKLKRDCSFKSKQLAELDFELSSANNERDSLRREVAQLKSSLGELKGSLENKEKCKIEGIMHAQKQLEDEIKFLTESNSTLTIQLNKSQEANAELVSILEELEDTVEKQRVDLSLTRSTSISENGVGMKDQMLLDIEAEWTSKLSAKEEEISMLEESLYKLQTSLHPGEKVSNKGNIDLMQETEYLRAKVEELERDCTELTEENLDLIYKLKESKKDVNAAKEFSSFSFNDNHEPSLPESSASDISHLKYQISQLEEELQRKDLNGAISIEQSTFQINDLKKKCTELEIELQFCRDLASDPDIKLRKCQVEVEKISHANELQQKHKCFEGTDTGYSYASTGQVPEILNSMINLEMPRILHDIDKQVHLALCHVRTSNIGHNTIAENCNEIRTDIMVPSSTDSASQLELIEDFLIKIIKLNSSLQAMIAGCKEFSQNTQEDGREKKLIAVPNVHFMADGMQEHNNEIFEELKLRNEELETLFLLKEKEIDALEASMKELEDMVSNMKKEKTQVEETLAVARRENNITSKCLDDVRNEMIILSSNVDNHVSVNKMLERKSSELEVDKREQVLHITELELENLKLTERISGLEARIDDKETNSLEFDGYKSHMVDFNAEISQKQAEIDAIKVEHRKKLQEVEKRFSVAHDESVVLKRSYSKLQSTVESLIEECNLLQKQTGDFQGQKLEMSEHISHLEVELMDLETSNFEHLNKVKVLEEKLSLLQSDFTLKDETLAAQLKGILQEIGDQEQKLRETNDILKHINQEKMVEVENLKLEILHLSTQVCSSQDERERIAANAVTEVSVLRLDKNKLENSLQETQSKLKLCEVELHNLTLESGNKVEGLVSLLNASKQSEEMLMTDIERMQKMTESLKSSEDSFRRMANELELKLKASDYEKQQIIEDVSHLKIQLQMLAQFQNEILNLKASLDEAKFEKEKMENLVHSVSEECEELKANIILLQNTLNDTEDDRKSRVALEEKLHRLEADLATRESSYTQETGMNEINRIRTVNGEFQRNIHGLEDEKGELTSKAQVLEKEIAQSKEEKPEEKYLFKTGNSRYLIGDQDKDKQIHEFIEGMPSLDADKIKGLLVESERLGSMEAPRVSKEVALESKIQSLQTELANALDANNIYQMQLNGLLSEKNNNAENSGNSPSENTAKTDQASKISSLETELREMRERYLHMSLQYAEVEAHREELVMQLKSAKKEKKWFS